MSAEAPWKYLIVMLDGAADEPQAAMAGQTPLEAAHTPTLRHLANTGRVGRVQLYPPRQPAHWEVDGLTAMLTLAGMRVADPTDPLPRAPLEVLAASIALGPKQTCVRLDLITADDGVVQQAATQPLNDGEARALVVDVFEQFGVTGWSLHALRGPRFLMVQDASDATDYSEMVTRSPRALLNKPMRKHLPIGGETAEWWQGLIAQSQATLAEHEINLTRREVGDPPATHVWPWGHGVLPRKLDWQRAMRNAYNPDALSAAVVSDRLWARGLGMTMGWDAFEAATCEPEDLALQTIAAMREHDVTLCHAATCLKPARDNDAEGKAMALEDLDRGLIKPAIEALQALADKTRVLVVGGPGLASGSAMRGLDSVPMVMAGANVPSVVQRPMTEAGAAASDLSIEPGRELMEFFLFSGRRHA